MPYNGDFKLFLSDSYNRIELKSYLFYVKNWVIGY